MGCANRIWGNEYHLPLDQNVVGGGIIDDIFYPIGRVFSGGTYFAGESWTTEPYDADTISVTVSYYYEIPNGGGANINDDLMGYIGPTAVDVTAWDNIIINDQFVTGPLSWFDGDPGNTIPQSGYAQFNATITDPTPNAVYQSLQGWVSTTMKISSLNISIVACGVNVQTDPVAPATCDIVGLTEAEIGWHYAIGHTVTWGPTYRTGTSLSFEATVTSTVDATGAGVMFTAFFVSDEFIVEGSTLQPPCLGIAPSVTLDWTGGTGPALEAAIVEGNPFFGVNGQISVGDTWTFLVSLNIESANCPVVLFQSFFNVEGAMAWGWHAGYAKVECDNNTCPQIPADVEITPGTPVIGDNIENPRNSSYLNVLTTGWTENSEFDEPPVNNDLARGFTAGITFPPGTTSGSASIEITATRTSAPGNEPPPIDPNVHGFPIGVIYLVNLDTQSMLSYAYLTGTSWQDGTYTTVVSTGQLTDNTGSIFAPNNIQAWVGVLTTNGANQWSWDVSGVATVTACVSTPPVLSCTMHQISPQSDYGLTPGPFTIQWEQINRTTFDATITVLETLPETTGIFSIGLPDAQSPSNTSFALSMATREQFELGGAVVTPGVSLVIAGYFPEGYRTVVTYEEAPYYESFIGDGSDTLLSEVPQLSSFATDANSQPPAVLRIYQDVTSGSTVTNALYQMISGSPLIPFDNDDFFLPPVGSFTPAADDAWSVEEWAPSVGSTMSLLSTSGPMLYNLHPEVISPWVWSVSNEAVPAGSTYVIRVEIPNYDDGPYAGFLSGVYVAWAPGYYIDIDGVTGDVQYFIIAAGCGTESPALTWHEPGTKIFETGIDRGAIYLPDGRVIPWNGLTSVNESFGQETEPVFYDGVKISEIQSSRGFSASVSAITYPDELEEACGGLVIRNGFHLWDQPPQSFGFTYRTIVGNDLEGIDAGYKLHLVYNVSATTSDRTYNTLSDEIELTEFEWDFLAVPEHLDTYRPSTHIVFDTTKTTPALIEIIQNYIWGTQDSPPVLPPLNVVIAVVLEQNNFINITDNGDGTWTASTDAVGIINDLGGEIFEIQEANIINTNSTTYIISPTPDPPQ